MAASREQSLSGQGGCVILRPANRVRIDQSSHDSKKAGCESVCTDAFSPDHWAARSRVSPIRPALEEAYAACGRPTGPRFLSVAVSPTPPSAPSWRRETRAWPKVML